MLQLRNPGLSLLFPLAINQLLACVRALSEETDPTDAPADFEMFEDALWWMSAEEGCVRDREGWEGMGKELTDGTGGGLDAHGGAGGEGGSAGNARHGSNSPEHGWLVGLGSGGGGRRLYGKTETRHLVFFLTALVPVLPQRGAKRRIAESNARISRICDRKRRNWAYPMLHPSSLVSGPKLVKITQYLVLYCNIQLWYKVCWILVVRKRFQVSCSAQNLGISA